MEKEKKKECYFCRKVENWMNYYSSLSSYCFDYPYFQTNYFLAVQEQLHCECSYLEAENNYYLNAHYFFQDKWIQVLICIAAIIIACRFIKSIWIILSGLSWISIRRCILKCRLTIIIAIGICICRFAANISFIATVTYGFSSLSRLIIGITFTIFTVLLLLIATASLFTAKSFWKWYQIY